MSPGPAALDELAAYMASVMGDGPPMLLDLADVKVAGLKPLMA